MPKKKHVPPAPIAKASTPKTPVRTTVAKPLRRAGAALGSTTETSGGVFGGLTLTLFALLAATLPASAVVIDRRRRRLPARIAVSSAAGRGTALVERPVEPLPPSTAIAEPVVAEPEPEEVDAFEAPLLALEDLCEITAWRGYAKWRFYARILAADGEIAVAESRPFRAAGSTVPEPTAAAERAHAEMASELERNGWLPAGRGDLWFERTFVRLDAGGGAPTGG